MGRLPFTIAERAPQTLAPTRVDWVDYAKGLCILLVVMFHTVNHYEEAAGTTGWLRAVVDFSKPFRMPDFFLISGLFLARTINAPLREFIDRKVIHFAYFYLLWLAITQLATQADILVSDPVEWAASYLWTIVQPVGSLWFVHMLAIFFVIVRVTRGLPKWLVLLSAAAIQIAHQALWIDTPSFAVNRAMEYFVYFFIGYAASGLVFAMADKVRTRRLQTLAVLLAWGVGNGVLAHMNLGFKPVYGLMMGLAGALAVIELSVLLSQVRFAGFLRYCGQNSIVIYLTFFLPMTALIKVLAPAQLIPDAGWACVAILVVAAATPLIFHRLVRKTWLSFLYERPAMFRLKDRAPQLTPAPA